MDQFTAMNITDSSCASTIKAILCARCNPYSGELYTIDDTLRTTPVLCDNSTSDFCTTTWNTCENVTIPNNPFSTTSNPAKLSDLYSSSSDFCNSAGGPVTNETVCFDGFSQRFPPKPTIPTPGICIERLDNMSFNNMAPHPDGSNRIFLATQSGKIFLAEVQDFGQALIYNSSNPFLDLTSRVYFGNEFGLLGLAFHPDFTSNGRFFVSYNCDSTTTPNCLGKCSCNSEIGCDPENLGTDNGATPCQYQAVVAEYTVNGTSSSPSTATVANPNEVQRIFTMGLPYTSHHAGEIYFGPKDGYLYFMMGDGGNSGDPWNFSQNKKSVLGKALRLNVNEMPTQDEIDSLGLWGNYTIPSDNPYFSDSGFRPEVWALGLRNPWRCSYDLQRSSYLFSGSTGNDNGSATVDEVNLLTKAGNYGWRVYDGFNLFQPSWAPGGSTPPGSINPIFPVLVMYRSDTHNNLNQAALVAGYVYRARTDPCLYGRFIYADLYGYDMWAAEEIPYMSGNFSSDRVNYTCTDNSPIPCTFIDSTTIPAFSYIFSFGQDNNKDIYLLAYTGVYRIVPPHLCGYRCMLDPYYSSPALAPSPV
ncbi:HIPL1 protein [Rhynchospora pubera]|uniref:HIPL1 protein n=1 Tax=Rhynchospora pubera TaxID=906938 RepID=A0AAV8DM22_9POAL|nr:HIPL1 protein [Rhynchospora pubera]